MQPAYIFIDKCSSAKSNDEFYTPVRSVFVLFGAEGISGLGRWMAYAGMMATEFLYSEPILTALIYYRIIRYQVLPKMTNISG